VPGEELPPLFERPVGADAEGPTFVGCGHQSEEQLGAGGVHRGEPDLIDQDEIRLQDLHDDLADRVVGQSPVEGFDEVGGCEVADTR